MKNLLRAISVSALGITMAAFAQQSPAKPGVPGYYNPKTHTFTARVTRETSPEPAATSKTYTGTIKFTIDTTLKTPVAAGQELLCSASADVEDAASGAFYEENASEPAVVSGSTATCIVNLPYSWLLEDGAADPVQVSYELIILPSSSSSATQYSSRDHSATLPSLAAVPGIGATTTISIGATI